MFGMSFKILHTFTSFSWSVCSHTANTFIVFTSGIYMTFLSTTCICNKIISIYLSKINEVKAYDDFTFSDNNRRLWVLYYYNFITGTGNAVSVESTYTFTFLFSTVIRASCILSAHLSATTLWQLKNNTLNKTRVEILLKWFIATFLIYERLRLMFQTTINTITNSKIFIV